MSATPTIVELQSVTKRFGDTSRPPILADISFTTKPGEFISLLGASGSGKSTLLRLIAGLTSPTSGRVLINGKPAESSDVAATSVASTPAYTSADSRGTTASAASTERAFIFQEATLLPWLTVRENAELLLKLRHVPSLQRRELASTALELARIAPLADRYPRQLSGGEKMRVSIARALTLDPALLLLDEPFGALDELTREHLNEELLALRERQNWSALFVTHSVAEAVFLSTRILILAQGRIAHDLAIDLPFPRNTATREAPAFHARVAEISRLLRTSTASDSASLGVSSSPLQRPMPAA